jgi:uncharacterized protein involved in high-affinity Fe2+ transport
LIRHRSRMFSAALACAVLIAATAATASATEYTAAPSWKAPPAQSAPVAFAQVERTPSAAQASASPVPVGAGWCIAFGAVLALGVLHTNRPREKPRLWA